MLGIISILLDLYFVVSAGFDIEPLRTEYSDRTIAKSKQAALNEFPHAVLLDITCYEKFQYSRYLCGASILNERFLLTVANCLYGCRPGSRVYAGVGHTRTNMVKYILCQGFLVHEKYFYREDVSELGYDIALIRLLEGLKFGAEVQRVALMRNPPYQQKAQVTGWGYLKDYDIKAKVKTLLKLPQYVHADCKKFIDPVPHGALCASSTDDGSGTNQTYEGDIGGALVVQGYIQIGIVSLRPRYRDVVIYMDTGFYYDWIMTHLEILRCYDGTNSAVQYVILEQSRR